MNKLFILFLISTSLSAQMKYDDVKPMKQKQAFIEEFNSKVNDWWEGNELVTTKFENGNYFINNKSEEDAFSWINFKFDESKDFQIEVAIKYLAGSLEQGFGIIWGKSDDGEYSFRISGNGFYRMDVFRGKYYPVADWTKTSYIDKDKENTLTIRKVDKKYYFFINKELVKIKSFSKFFGHEIGVQAGTNTSIAINFIKIVYI